MKELTILMPCLNEAETIGMCIKRAEKLLEENRLEGEILVSDNGSSDSSREIALSLGARVIQCATKGYGAALQFGIENAEGDFVLMGDSDDSYHFDEGMPMIERLRNGYDVCMGTRLKGRIMPKAMPDLNRYIGNPLLTFIGRLFFDISLSDFHCGMRAFRRDKILSLNIVTTGMEWASEMIIKASLAGLRMTEVPITLYKDGRARRPHLRRWRDGWRHLRFMLLHSPKWLFFVPGFILFFMGLLGEAVLTQGTLHIGRAELDVHSLLVMAFVLLAGAQMVFTGIFAKLYSFISGILPYDERFDRLVRRLTLERLLVASTATGVLGTAGFLYTLWEWYNSGFSGLDYRTTMRHLVPSLTMVALSVQGIYNGFMLSVLFLKTKGTRQTLPEENEFPDRLG
ncbi:MAG TPA: glycosyltransferase family 2 protein [Thermodesulfovibrionales bacterium]|nr:glycosyltransferase family 2 protein [Thermodesulfovibrionales bacterium]